MKDEKEAVIAGIKHNLECVEEAINSCKNFEDRRKFRGEKMRLQRLLAKYEKEGA